MSPIGKTVRLASWGIMVVVGLFFMRGLTIGDPTAASPLLFANSPYNVAHRAIQESFGGVEPLIVVAEGHDKDAMKDPQTLRTMEKFQRLLERDPGIGYSFSLADIIRAVNGVFHELEPKWRVIPDSWTDIGGLFLGFFTIWVILLFTYRSFTCGLYLLGPLIASNIVVNAYMAVNNIGVNIHTLPLVTVGVGFGIDYGLYIVSRIIEEIRIKGDLVE